MTLARLVVPQLSPRGPSSPGSLPSQDWNPANQPATSFYPASSSNDSNSAPNSPVSVTCLTVVLNTDDRYAPPLCDEFYFGCNALPGPASFSSLFLFPRMEAGTVTAVPGSTPLSRINS